jgi:hypothetical protein
MSNKATYIQGEELQTLVSLCAEHASLLYGTFKGSSGSAMKAAKWQEILDSVNAVGQNNRTMAQIQRKMTNIRQTTKAIASSNKTSIIKTGGGEDETDELNDTQKMALATISTHSIKGIPRGFDIHAKNEFKDEKLGI